MGEPDCGGEWPVGAFYGEGSHVEMRGGGVADASVSCFCCMAVARLRRQAVVSLVRDRVVNTMITVKK